MEELTKRIEALEQTIDTLMFCYKASSRRTSSQLDLLKYDIKTAKLEILVELEKQR